MQTPDNQFVELTLNIWAPPPPYDNASYMAEMI